MKVTLTDGLNSVCVSPHTGQVHDLSLNGIAPLHRAPWLDEADVQADHTIPMIERQLQGDFFCAPFGKSDLIDAPIHGMTANSSWDLISRTANSAHFRLQASVMGAVIEKTVTLDGDALHQTHRIRGGTQGLPVAHHPMVHMAKGGRLSFSPKRGAVTPDTPLEPGKNWLESGAQATDIKTFASTTGTADLSRYPDRTKTEDFITLIEAEGAAFGWTAIARAQEQDLIVILKDPRCLPVTMLWYSNGGRDYAPWNGRHRGVLGVEDGCAAGAAGHVAAVSDNAVSRFGVPTALMLQDGTLHETRHAIYAVPFAHATAGGNAGVVTHISVQAGNLVATLNGGLQITFGRAPTWLLKPLVPSD